MNKGWDGWAQKWIYIVAAVAGLVALITLTKVIDGGGHYLQWLNLLVRWFHIVIGIAWIGASFYFIWLENNLVRSGPDVRDELAGNLWAVHGGGFYYLEKYKTAPKTLPKTLHWFQWEAYLTFISGFGLLIIVYYANAQAAMVKPEGIQLPAFMTILIGLATLLLGWLIYDRMCRSKLVEQKALFSVIGFGLVTLLAYGLSFVLSGRAAFIHVGAMLGTIMAANVFFTIIPAQRAMVKAAVDGEPVNPELGKHAGLRSLHNNYITLPVIFTMISNHYPSTFSQSYNWLVLAGLFIGSAAVRHFLNVHEQGKHPAPWLLPAASLVMLSLALVTAPAQRFLPTDAEPIAFTEVQQIVTVRCASCHAAMPTDEVFQVAPKGILLDSAEAVLEHSDAIYTHSVLSNYMPLGNKTGMLESERERLGLWYAQMARASR